MAKLIALDKASVDREPYLLWNAFIELISESEPEDLSDIQSVAKFAFWYDSEVQNGGHLQYFENSYIRYESKINVLISATLEALKILGAKKQAKIFASASAKYLSSLKKHPKDIQEYTEQSLRVSLKNLILVIMNARLI
jgi:hypothetical protein